MTNFLRLLTISFCMLFFLLVDANGQFQPMQNVDMFKKRMQTESQNTSSISCNFIQERHLAVMTKPIVSKGKFWFKKPASVRWEYHEPYSTLIILSKRKVFIREDKKQQEYDMQSGSAFQNLGKIMFNFILGDITSAENDFNIEYFENKELFFVRLVPKIIKPNDLQKIELFFEKKDYSLAQIIMYENADDYTSIKFTDIILNGHIDAGLFKMK